MISIELSQALKSFYGSKPNMAVPSFSGDGVSEEQPISQAYINLTLLNFSETTLNNPEGLIGSLSDAEAEVDNSLRRRKPVELGALLNQRGKDNQLARRILVTGRAGIGKSTLCHRIAYEWSQGRLWPDVPAVIWVPLKSIEKYEYKRDISIAEWLLQECFPEGTVTLAMVQLLMSTDSKKDYLFLLDGFDEVSHLLDKFNALKNILSMPFALVTTRPYARPDRDANIQFDLHVENIGFKNSDVSDYIEYRFKERPEKANSLDNYLNRNFPIRTACYIPLNLFLLSHLWDKKELANNLNFTEFYIEFLNAFLRNYMDKSRKFNYEDKLNSRDWTLLQLEERLASELHALEEVAFTQLSETQQLIIPLEKIEAIMKTIDPTLTIAMLREMGFLKPVHQEKPGSSHSSAYYFVHLTFQEFFAARFIARKIKERAASDESAEKKAQKEGALYFVTEHKYHPRYTVMMQFISGLIFSNREKSESANKAKTYLWDALLSHEIDLVGLKHQELIISALEESREIGLSPELLHKTKQDIVQWLRFSYTTPEAETPGVKKLREKARDTLGRAFSNSPRVANEVLKNLKENWGSLNESQQVTVIKYYLIEWVNSLPEAAEFLLAQLSNEGLSQQQREAILQEIPWERLKETHVKYPLRATLLALLKTLITPIKEEAISLLGLVLDALSFLIDEDANKAVDESDHFKEAVTALLNTLSEQLQTDATAHLTLSLAILQDRLTHQTGAMQSFEVLLTYPENNITQQQCEYAIRHADIMGKHYPDYKQSLMEALHAKLQRFAAENNWLVKTIAVVLKQMGDTSSDVLQYTWEGAGGERRSQLDDLIEQKVNALQALVLKTDVTATESKKIEALIEGMVVLIVEMPSALVQVFVTALLKAAEDKDSDVRGAAIDALGKTVERISPDLLRSVMDILLKAAAEDKDSDVRRAAIDALGKTVERMPPDLLPSVMDVLLKAAAEDKDSDVRRAALDALGETAERIPLDLLPSVIDVLLKVAAEDKDSDVRRAAIDALGKTVKRMPPDLLPSVMDILLKAAAENKDSYYIRSAVRSAVIDALGKTVERMPPDLLPSVMGVLLKAATEDKDSYGRSPVIDALGKTVERMPPDLLPSAMDVLLKAAAEDKDSDARGAVIHALSKTVERMPPDLLPSVMDILLKAAAEDKDSDARGAAIHALSKTVERMPPDLLPSVMDVLLKAVAEDKDSGARGAAIHALSKTVERMPPDLLPSVMDILLKAAVENKDSDVRRVAINALGNGAERIPLDLLPNAMGVLLKIAAENKDSYYIRRAVIDALDKTVERVPPDLLPSVMDVLLKAATEDKDSDVRRVVIHALGNAAERMPPDLLPSAMDVLLKAAAEDKDSYIRWAAIDALGNAAERMPTDLLKSVIDFLLKVAAEDKDSYIRRAAINALVKTVEQMPPDLLRSVMDILLKAAAEDKDSDVRRVAINALGKAVKRMPPDLLLGVMDVLLKAAAEDKDSYVRRVAINALGKTVERMPPDLLWSVMDILLKAAAEDKDSDVRRAAIDALGKTVERMPPDLLPSAMDALLKATAENKDEQVHKAAIWVLAQFPIEDCSIDAYETLLRLAKDDTSIDISMAAIQCLNKIKKIKSEELNRHSLKLFLGDLSSHDDVIVRSALKQLQAFKANTATSTMLVQLLLELLWEGSHYQGQISHLLFSFNVSFEELLTTYQTFFQHLDVRNSGLSQQRLEWFIMPLVEYLFVEGFTIQQSNEKCPELYLTSYDGKSIILLNAQFSSSILQTVLRLIKNQLKSAGLSQHPSRELIKSDVPRYLQRSSIRFFHAPRLEAWRQSFPLIPTITQNQAIAARQSETLHPQLIEGNPWRPIVIPNQNDLPFNVFIFSQRNAIKVKTVNNQLMSSEALNDAIVNHVPTSTTYLDLSDCQLTDESVQALVQCQAQLKHVSILKLSNNCITKDGLTALLELAQQLKQLHYLFLDHNHIVFDDVYCEEVLKLEQLEITHLVHLDLSMNFIQNGKLSIDENNDRTLSYQESREQLREEGILQYCKNFISDSLIAHSKYDDVPVQSIINPGKYISPEKGEIALIINKKEHALLVFETLDIEFGQRVLLIGDLITRDNKHITIRLYRISPDDFLKNYRDGVQKLSASIKHVDIEKLINKVLESKDREGMYTYSMLAAPKRFWSYNCLEWAYEQLQAVGINREQEHPLPSQDIQGRKCTIS